MARTVNPPIQRGSTVLIPTAAQLYDGSVQTYGRMGLSMQNALQDGLAELEGGVAARLYPSGLGAVTAVLLSLLGAGDEVLLTDCVYGPTRRFCDNVLTRYGIKVGYFPADASPEETMAAAGDATRLILMESPGSLTFEIQDVPAIAAAARARGILTAVDNTWGAGLLYRPLDLGVDVSIQALTKYVAGHADVLMGSAAVRDAALARRLDLAARDFGWSVSPDDAYLVLRGLRSLPARMRVHEESALKIAAWLPDRPEVRQVLCPALPGAPGHDIWKRDFKGVNGLFSIVLNPVPEAKVLAMLDRLELFGLGFSWGGFESLVIHCDPQLKRTARKADFGGPVVRLHVGQESVEDLIADLDQAFGALA